jgi:hypothetical protein
MAEVRPSSGTGSEPLRPCNDSDDALAAPFHATGHYRVLSAARITGAPFVGEATAAVARKVLIAAWHVLARQEPFKPTCAAA